MCDLNNAGPRMPWIPPLTLALDRNYQELEIGCGAQGEANCLWQPLVSVPPHPGAMDAQTGRHLPKSLSRKGLYCFHVSTLYALTRHAAGSDSRWGGFTRPRVVADTCFSHLSLSFTTLF